MQSVPELIGQRTSGEPTALVEPVHILGAVRGLWAQVDQRALAEQLLRGDRQAREHALVQARSLGRQNTGTELREALIKLLDRNNRLIAEATSRKVSIASVESPEFIAHVAHAVSQLHDPRAIPALAGALGTGSTLVHDALADFGELAAGDVLRVVAAAASRYEAVNDGLLALRFMVEGHGAPRLSDSTRDQIRQVTKQRLSGRQWFTTVWYAIDLAVALDDAELRRIVESLAANGDTVAARGIEKLELIEMTRARAAGRLAGKPALPKYRSLDERDQSLNDRPRQR